MTSGTPGVGLRFTLCHKPAGDYTGHIILDIFFTRVYPMIGAFSGIKWIQMDLYILHRKHLEFIGQTAAKTVRVNDWSRLED